MNEITIPEKATGRVGMVAVLKRVRECDVGKLVVLREPAGYVTSLIGSVKPVFAWLAQALGEPIDCAGKASRTIYVADACLSPVAEMSESEFQEIISGQYRKDFDQALIEARNILDAHHISDDELDVLLQKAGEQVFLQKALEIVVTPIALHEIGFKSASASGRELHWTGIHEGVELRVSASLDLFDRWLITGISHSSRHWQYEEHVLPNEIQRGKVFLTVLNVWRTAYGRSMIPDLLLLGDIYERHLADMRRVNPGPPVLYADPQIFRTTLKWLTERHLKKPDSAHELSLAFADGLLWLRINDKTYTCPADGRWIADYAISVVDLANLPPKGRRGQIRIEQGLDHLIVNGYPMSARQLESDTNVRYTTPEVTQPVQAASDAAPSKSVEVREIEYYDDTWDSSNYLVCFNRYYIFAIRPKDAEPKWEYLHPDGARWDAVHQRVYRNFDADRISRDQLPATLPPPPDSIAPELLLPLPPPPPEIFLRADYPNLDKRLQGRDGAMPLYLILMEDRYESLHGDGKFHYPETIFFGEGEALTFKASSDDSYTYYIRAGLIWLDGDNIECKMPRRTFDHFSYGEVMRLAEPKLNTLEKGSQ
jgi:hypothetical protein